jgi:hypothetical protein
VLDFYWSVCMRDAAEPRRYRAIDEFVPCIDEFVPKAAAGGVPSVSASDARWG